MTSFVALLRAVNVGGTGALPMAQLKIMCTGIGFYEVRTYIASGNVLFKSEWSEAKVKAALAARLHEYAGKPIDVMVRTAAQLAAIESDNPFPDAPRNRAVAIFLSDAPMKDMIAKAVGRAEGEELRLGRRELYVRYTEGMADSKLRIPGAEHGTARNMNTVTKLAALSAS